LVCGPGADRKYRSEEELRTEAEAKKGTQRSRLIGGGLAAGILLGAYWGYATAKRSRAAAAGAQIRHGGSTHKKDDKVKKNLFSCGREDGCCGINKRLLHVLVQFSFFKMETRLNLGWITRVFVVAKLTVQKQQLPV
jgi:hypothetical protein